MRLAEKLRGGRAVCGTMLRITRNPAIVPIAKGAGLDFVMVDMEHGACSFENLSDLATVARAEELGLMVRVPELSRGTVSRALDCGADAVMVPMVESVEQARQLAQWGKYPPIGKRGLSSMGAHTRYRRISDPSEAMAAGNRDTLTIAQMETATAAQVADEIAAIEGIDALLVGPNDLAVSLGCPGDLYGDAENTAIEAIAGAAAEAGKILGMHAGPELLGRWAGHGLRILMNSIDIAAYSKALEAVATETRAIADQGCGNG